MQFLRAKIRCLSYAYDDLGKLISVIDQSGHTIAFTWNQFGLDSRTTAIGQVTQNYYDDFWRLKAIDSKFGNQSADRSFEYKYDNLDRTVEIKYGKNEIERIKYDSWGRIVEKFKNGRGSYFKYDHFGRLIEKSEDNVLIRYVYDNYGHRILRSANKDKDIWNEANTYDKYGRLIKTEAGGKSVGYIYNDKNQLAEQIVDSNKIKFSYTKLGQLESKILFDKDGKELSELRYFYSRSGKIISRLANGKLQSYKYDTKNQLTSVYDEESKSFVEEYVYDPSGNILKKTINGEITTYTYDAANQLVSSVSPDGKITSYAYDAAGRMIREGNKTYEYGWLDKVMRVAENGKEVARFEYQNNGQIAKAIRNDNVETFAWDGLALVKRDEVKYINEPHIGGGNPVLAIKGESVTILNDALGSTLGVFNGNIYSEVTKTTFGDHKAGCFSFFSGKPYVNDLGYTFLFRNYRADLGKWLSQDLFGFVDGLNTFAYCKNFTTSLIDLYGAASASLRGRYVQNSLGQAMHTSMHISVSASEYAQLSDSQKGYFNQNSDGSYGTIISGYEHADSFEDFMIRNTYLELRTNDSSDIASATEEVGNINVGLFEIGGETYGNDITMLDFVKNYLDAATNYKAHETSVDYDWFPNDPDEGNCNSLQNSLVKKAGGILLIIPEKENERYPGLNHDMDDTYFE